MDYFSLGSKLDYPDLNALVYLLRKFKRLTSDLRLGSNSISSDYGTYNVAGGLTSVGGNFILEDTVTISSSDVLLNCFYTFHFTVVDVNLSGTVNRRVVSVTGDTGDDGVLEVVLEPSLLESDEVILPDFKGDIVFDEHEYYTPVSSLDITLSVDKEYITVGESNTVTATVLDGTGSPAEDLELQFDFNGDVVTDVTDSDGIASAEYTGVGAGWVTVTVSGESIRFFDGCLVATVTGDSISFGSSNLQWLYSTGDVVIDWGDGTTSTVNNPKTILNHTYSDEEQSHTIKFKGEVTGIGNQCFENRNNLTSIWIPYTVTSLGYRCFIGCTGLTSVTLSDGVTSLGNYCFYGCTGLTTVTIPSSVTSLGSFCFYGCTGLTSVTIPNSVTSLGDYCFMHCTELTSVTIPNRVTSIGDSCFNDTGLTTVTIPSSVSSIGVRCFKWCGSLIDYQLYWTGNGIISYDSEKMPNNTNSIFTIPIGETTNYVAKNYPSNKLVERGTHTYSLSIASDKQSILTSESVTISGTLLIDSSGYSGQSVALYDGSTLINTLTTDNNGEYSKTLIGLSAGTHTFKAVNTNAESSTITVTVTEPTPVHNYSITIVGDSIIQTGDNDNITATLKDNGVVVSGETLSYQIKHGNTTIDTGTDTTDSNGQVEISYTGTGVGDVQVIVSYGSLLQEIYEVQDCLFYDDASINRTSEYTITSAISSSLGTLTYSNNEYYHTGGGSNNALLITVDSLGKISDCEIELIIKPTSNVFGGAIGIGFKIGTNTAYGIVCYVSTNSRKVKYPWADSYSAYYSDALESIGDGYYKLKVQKIGNTVTFVKTGESFTMTGDTHYIGLMKGQSDGYFKGVKIKAL